MTITSLKTMSFHKTIMIPSRLKDVTIVSHFCLPLCELDSNMVITIVPYLLSVCAIHYKDEVVTGLKIGRKEQRKYEAKAAKLFQKDLEDSIDSIWYSLPDLDRDIMIKLWLTRPNIRTLMAHPTPTVEEGINVIRAEPQLSEAERCFINHLLPNAVDKEQEHLFIQTT